MAILGHFWPYWDILLGQPGQNGEKIEFFIKVKNVGKTILKPSPTDLERFRMVLGVKKSIFHIQKVCRYRCTNSHS